MFGKLTLHDIPFDQPIIMGTIGVLIAGILGLLGLITYLKRWRWLWEEWITSVDHKRIGVMYILLALVMLLRGFSDALMMRTQLALAGGGHLGYLPPEHYDQVFSAHGTIMIFFVAMPFVVGLMNIVVPLQIGARDVAFPVLNSISFWLTAAGALLPNIALGIGEFARTGWLAYPPLSELPFSPGVGVDYYLVALQLSGVGTLLSAINLITTILKMRAPGMEAGMMPVFTWTALGSNMLIIAAFPILTVTLGLLMMDRYLGMHFFTNDAGGSPMLFINLIWGWGHPEVYILVLPIFGVYSEVIATFSGKPLFGYRSMVTATLVITILAFTVWLHHFFTMGAGADVNAIFGIASMLIAIPTGVKVFNWLFTMYGGRIRFEPPVLWTVGFMVTFVIGGMTGVMLAVPSNDFLLHNSLFLIAHFHNVIIGGVVFGLFAALEYWFPKVFGFTLEPRLGKAAFWCWFVGFYLAFMPLYVLGFLGMTRRTNHYDNPAWDPYILIACGGAFLILAGICLQAAQLVVSIRTRNERRDLTGDPWGGRTLEWSLPSPPPAFNFPVLPAVEGLDAYWASKSAGLGTRRAAYEDIWLPENSPVGFFLAAFAAIGGFAVVWHIWWLALAGLIGAICSLIASSWREHGEICIPAAEVARSDRLANVFRVKN